MDALMPDPGRIIGTHLRSHPRVTAKVGTRSSDKLSATLPANRYTVTSNPRTGVEQWQPTVQVECWAPEGRLEDAWATARAVVASTTDLVGVRATGDVAQVDVTNVFAQADPDTDRPRVLVLLSLLVYALDSVELL